MHQIKYKTGRYFRYLLKTVDTFPVAMLHLNIWNEFITIIKYTFCLV